jgi:hypothetical protein
MRLIPDEFICSALVLEKPQNFSLSFAVKNTTTIKTVLLLPMNFLN